MDFKQLAIQKHEEWQADMDKAREQLVCETRERDIQWLTRELLRLAVAPDAGMTIAPVPETGHVIVDGIEFAAQHYEGRRYLVMLGVCPSCQQTTQSHSIITLVEIGGLIAKFQPHPGHNCYGLASLESPAEKDIAPEPTADEIFLDALHEYICRVLDDNCPGGRCQGEHSCCG